MIPPAALAFTGLVLLFGAALCSAFAEPAAGSIYARVGWVLTALSGACFIGSAWWAVLYQ